MPLAALCLLKPVARGFRRAHERTLWQFDLMFMLLMAVCAARPGLTQISFVNALITS